MNSEPRIRTLPSPALGAEERVRAILGLVQTRGFQPIDALAALFGVTTQTIRRDVNTLCVRRWVT